MPDQNDKLNELEARLEFILKRQDEFLREVSGLRIEINKLKTAQPEKPQPQVVKPSPPPAAPSEQKTTPPPAAQAPQPNVQPAAQPAWPVIPPVPPRHAQAQPQTPTAKSDLEKFIGENLINKIGIAITVIGVAIGAKYAIDHQLISPLTRIILGYLTGAVLLFLAIRLKKNYENFSAVLLSGSMAIMYFITFAAYSFYGLLPQVAAFGVMVLFTAFTVAAAINYNLQVIALIGLVGSYAVPFLLSDGSGRVVILFSYMSIINAGILVIAFKKYWKLLYYAAFALTWFIFLAWFGTSYETELHFGIALTFLSVFFLIFYATFLAYKLIRREQYNKVDILLLILNSFIFYGTGYTILQRHDTGEELLGLFTLVNAIVHFAVSRVIHVRQQADRNLFYLVIGLVLVFITIAVPVQLEGNWVTLVWSGEAALLFWIGRTKQVPAYEKLSYPLMYLAFFSLLEDWLGAYGNYYPADPETRLTTLFNIHMLTSLLFIASFGFINWLYHSKKYSAPPAIWKRTHAFITYSLPLILIFALYYSFRLEIEQYWGQRYVDSELAINSVSRGNTFYWNRDLKLFGSVWTINYSLLFVSVLALVNIKKLRDERLAVLNGALLLITLFIFHFQGLLDLSELRESYIEQPNSQFYFHGAFNLGIRYISIAFAAFALYAIYLLSKANLLKRSFRQEFGYLLHACILWIASSELIQWLALAGTPNTYKLALSILWGGYALLMIVLGIWKKKKYLRIAAIVLFGLTLVKLFFYDISHLDTISKTIVFVSLGALLLIISFLYNKYKHIISDDTTTD